MAVTLVSLEDVRHQFAIRDWETLVLPSDWAHRGLQKAIDGTLSDEALHWIFVRLVDLPRKKIDTLAVPAGRYKLLNGDRVHLFAKQFPMAKRVSRTGRDYGPLLTEDDRRRAFGEVAWNHQAAARRYGRDVGRCGYCNLELEDPVSLRVGAGEICAGRYGITWA